MMAPLSSIITNLTVVDPTSNPIRSICVPFPLPAQATYYTHFEGDAAMIVNAIVIIIVMVHYTLLGSSICSETSGDNFQQLSLHLPNHRCYTRYN